MVYERSKQTRWLPGLYSLLLYDFVKSVVIVFYNIMRERIYEGAVSGLLFQLEAEDLIQKLPVSMQPYGADNGAYIAPVSYTHLDVYKRQAYVNRIVSGTVWEVRPERVKAPYTKAIGSSRIQSTTRHEKPCGK